MLRVGMLLVFDTSILPKSSAQLFVERTFYALRRVKTNKSKTLSEDINAHVGNDARVWKGVICQHGDADIKDNSCCNRDVTTYSVSWTLSSHTELCPVHQVQRFVGSMVIDLCIVSAVMFQSVSDVRVKRNAERSTNHPLVFCNLILKKQDQHKHANWGGPTE